MIKLLLGGSPCTYWSIAQKNHRETEPSGMGWELFKNYLIAKEKFCPDFFLYENNKSAAKAIKEEIKKCLQVWDGSFLNEDSGVRYIEINSALVSAQNRQRFYVHNCGEVQQPQDRGILLQDILEYPTGIAVNDLQGKSGTIRASCYKDGIRNLIANDVDRRTCVAQPVILQNAHGWNKGGIKEDKAPTLTANGAWQDNNKLVAPIRVGEIGEGGQGNRIYSIEGKAVSQTATSGGLGSNTGLYAFPVENVGEVSSIQKAMPKLADKYGYLPEKFNAYNLAKIEEKSPTLSTGSMVTSSCATTLFETVSLPRSCIAYEVKDGVITIKGKHYATKLKNGYYIIRKLTVTECCRLQTLPDDYCRVVSNAQAYKGLGNGWTAEVIIHILGNALNAVPKEEKLVVLSMYDGIGTGRYCLDKMGFKNVTYYAYEIDKYAKQIAMSNYPDIIQCGDAYALRESNWKLS